MKASNLLEALRAVEKLAPALNERAEYNARDLSLMSAIELGADVPAQAIYDVLSQVERGWDSPRTAVPGRVLKGAMASQRAADLLAKLETVARR